jgi:hypothetical protein
VPPSEFFHFIFKKKKNKSSLFLGFIKLKSIILQKAHFTDSSNQHKFDSSIASNEKKARVSGFPFTVLCVFHGDREGEEKGGSFKELEVSSLPHCEAVGSFYLFLFF